MVSRAPFFVSFLLYVLCFVLGTIGFGTGFWYIGEGPDRKFQRLGLWEACFDGYEHTSDYIGKAYYGCWWVFHKEYSYVKDWILPAWFVVVQTLMTFAIVTMFITLVIYCLSMAHPRSMKLLTLICWLVTITFLCLAISVVIFGVMVGEDRTWMPRFDIDELGWSYGLVVISGFSAAFSLISLAIFTLMRKWENLPKDDIDYSKAQRIEMPAVPKI